MLSVFSPLTNPVRLTSTQSTAMSIVIAMSKVKATHRKWLAAALQKEPRPGTLKCPHWEHTESWLHDS